MSLSEFQGFDREKFNGHTSHLSFGISQDKRNASCQIGDGWFIEGIMGKITFITPDGKEIVEENGVGSVMEIAQQNQVPGIEGACGGCCSCATCHVRVLSLIHI